MSAAADEDAAAGGTDEDADGVAAAAAAADRDGDADGEKCAICLSEIEGRALLDVCFHSFCFDCIQTWAEVTPSCPLCKRDFTNIIHSILSDKVRCYPSATLVLP